MNESITYKKRVLKLNLSMDQKLPWRWGLNQLVRLQNLDHDSTGTAFFSTKPTSPFYVNPQKREILKQCQPFLTQENIQKYMVNFCNDTFPVCAKCTCTNYAPNFQNAPRISS